MNKYATHYQSLPTGTRRLFFLGLAMAFLVALPLFVNTLVNQNFDIRNRASGIKPGEIILNEFTPTPVPTLTPYISDESASQTQTNYFPVLPTALGVLILSLILVVIGIKKSRSVIK